MNDPRFPFHAISHYDADGNIPFQTGFPAEEDDFATVEQARLWLQQRGGGVIETPVPAQKWEKVETVPPGPILHFTRCVKRH